jgi:hypothetical protein
MCALAALLPAAPVAAQGFGDAPVLFFDVGIGANYEDRRNQDGKFEATTRVGLGLFTSTDVQRLSFETGITARLGENGGDLTDPFVALSWARFNRGAEIGVELSFRQSQVDGADLDDDFGAGDLERQDGTQEDFDLALSLITGRDAPFGTQTELRYEQRTFGGGATTDDSRTHSISSTLRFTIDPRIELRFSGFAEEKETDDAIDTVRTVQRWSLAGDFDIDRVWTAGANIGFAEIETETIGGTAVEEGLEAGFLISRALRNGGLSFSSALVITDDGWRNSVRLSRVINLANGDSFNASIGQIFFEEGSSGHLAALSYTRTVRSGFLSFGFDYASDLDDADLLIQRTRANAVLRQDITDNSGWVLDGALASVMYDNPITPDAVRFDVGLSYLHGLSNDWNLAARVEHQVLYEDGAIDDTTNVFSLTLERRFSARP